MKGVPVRTSMSPLEIAVWAAEFVRVREGSSGHAELSEASSYADQAVIDLREMFGTEHSSLALREANDDPDAQLAVLRERLLRNRSDT